MDSREERVARALYEQQFPGSVWPHSADRAESWREMARAAIKVADDPLADVAAGCAQIMQREDLVTRLSEFVDNYAYDINMVRGVMRDARDYLAALSPDERPTAAMLAAGMSAWEATAGTREDMLRNAYVAMNEYRLSTTKADRHG